MSKKKEKKKNPEKKDSEKLLEDKEKEIAELTDMVKRTRAELINYENRITKESRQNTEYANASLVKELLPVLDSFELALKNSQDFDKFKDGMEMIFAQFFGILKQQGLTPINVENKKFDPHLHEVLIKQKSDKEEDTILEELQRGYKFKERVIRHSKVKVSE